MGGVIVIKKFSIYDIVLRQADAWRGKQIARFWRTYTAEHKEEVRRLNTGKTFYLGEEIYDEDYWIDLTNQSFATYQATPTMEKFDDAFDRLAEKNFDCNWWVYLLGQFELIQEYWGFQNKKEAYTFYKEKKKDDEKYWSVCIFHISEKDITDFIPINNQYPVQEIMEKKYSNYIGSTKPPYQSFPNFFAEYLESLLTNNYHQHYEDDAGIWYNLLLQCRSIKQEIENGKIYQTFHLYDLLNSAYRYMYDDFPFTIDDFN